MINNKSSLESLDVLLLCDNNIYSVVGGAEESTKIIIDGIKDEISTGAIFPGTTKVKDNSVNYYYLTSSNRLKHLIKNPLKFIKYIVDIRNIILETKPKVIHTQAQVSFFIIAFLKKFKLIPKDICLLHTERGLFTKYNIVFKHIFYFFIKELNTLVTTTEFNMKYWKEALEKKSYYLDYRIIENTAGRLFETYDESLNMKDEEKLTIGFAGRYCDWKNWPLAVDICKKLHEILSDKLYVKMAVGCLDERARQDTEKMFQELDGLIGSRFDGVINIDINAMDRFYYDIDIFVLTSNYNTESFGRTLVEAMSRKTIVLTTNAGGSVEVVGNHENVCESTLDFINRIEHFNNDKELMELEKENNLIRVKQKYSLKNNLDKHIKLYEKLLIDESNENILEENN